MNAKQKIILDRIEFLKDAIRKANEYLESGKHADWRRFRPLFDRKLRDGKELPPHRDWVKNVFLPRRERALTRAEKLLQRLSLDTKTARSAARRRERRLRAIVPASVVLATGVALPLGIAHWLSIRYGPYAITQWTANAAQVEFWWCDVPLIAWLVLWAIALAFSLRRCATAGGRHLSIGVGVLTLLVVGFIYLHRGWPVPVTRR